MDDSEANGSVPTDVDPFEEFNRAMGAHGDASPYPDFIRLRGEAPVHAVGVGLARRRWRRGRPCTRPTATTPCTPSWATARRSAPPATAR